MSWDTFIENTSFYIDVESNRLARHALKAEIKSLAKMAGNDTIAEWLPFLSEKGLTKSLKRDIATIIAKKLAEKASNQTTTSNQNSAQSYSKTQPSS